MNLPFSPWMSGKYSEDKLPPGPRGLLFRQLLPEAKPLIATLEAVAASRKKTPSQVSFQPGDVAVTLFPSVSSYNIQS